MITEINVDLQPGAKAVTEICAIYVPGFNKYRVSCKAQLTQLRQGVTPNGVIGEFGANNTPNVRAGWFSYYMTERAFKAFSKNNDITVFSCLD